ncbi:MAG: DUF952 domain-containing protein [Acidimicrobiia bacterium]
MIVHLTDAGTWARAQAAGELRSASLTTEGFAHCSTIAQIIEVGNRFYRGASDLVLLAIDESSLTVPLRWEAPAHPDGSPAQPDEPLFPHVYGAIALGAIIDVAPFLPGPDGAFDHGSVPASW